MNHPPSPEPEPKIWFYADESNQPIGPLSLADLKQLKAVGTISNQTLVVKEGNSEWEPFPVAIAFAEEDRTPDYTGPSKQVQEYRRTCRACGKVWHSLVDREAGIQADMKNALCDFCMCSPSVTVQAKRNVAAQKSEISRLRSCPQCQSGVYDEEIVSHSVPVAR